MMGHEETEALVPLKKTLYADGRAFIFHVMKFTRLVRFAAVSLALSGGAFAAAPINTLSTAEKNAGWKLLFDGRSLAGWHPVSRDTPPGQGWLIKDGVLVCVAGGKGGNLVTDQLYDNFDFSWEWKMPAKANNGVKYFVTDARAGLGHEYQLIDDAIVPADHADGMTAAFYLVVAPDPAKKKVKPFGEWNHSRIVVVGQHVEHWLNGEKVLEYECGSPAILAQVKKTKFNKTKDFGEKLRGRILLTYHNDEAAFRNLKIRELPGK